MFSDQRISYRMIKHILVFNFISTVALHEIQANDWMRTNTNNNLMEEIDQGIQLCAHPVGERTVPEEMYIDKNLNVPIITRKSLKNCFGIKKLRILPSQGLKFEESAFTDLTTLEVLILENVEYKHVTQDFARNLKSLRSLTISACGVEEIDQNAFSALENLEHLDLSHNNLSMIHRLFKNLGKLKTLDLFENELTSFPWDELKHLGELEWFSLGKNKIDHYDVDKIVKYLPKVNVIFVDFKDGMPCSVVNELRNEFRTKAANVRVYEGIGSDRVRNCPVQEFIQIPQFYEVYAI